MELTSFDSRKGQLKYISYFIKKKRKNYITKIFFKRKVRGLRIGTHQYASFLPFKRKEKKFQERHLESRHSNED